MGWTAGCDDTAAQKAGGLVGMTDHPFHIEVERRLQLLATNLIALQFASGDVKVVDEGEGPHTLSNEWARIFLTRMSHNIDAGGSTPYLSSEMPVSVEFGTLGTDDDARRARRAELVSEFEAYLFLGGPLHKGDLRPATKTSVDWNFSTVTQNEGFISVAQCQFVVRWEDQREIDETLQARFELVAMRQTTGGLVLDPEDPGGPVIEAETTLTSQ